VSILTDVRFGPHKTGRADKDHSWSQSNVTTPPPLERRVGFYRKSKQEEIDKRMDKKYKQ